MRSKIMKVTVLVRVAILAMVLASASSSWGVCAAGFTSNLTVGQMLLLENNRIWPTGIPYDYSEPCNVHSGHPDPAWVPHEWQAEYFRQALHRLIDRTALEALYAPLKKKAERWLPEGEPALWRKPGLRLPTWDPMTAIYLLNRAGFVQGTKPNPYHNPAEPWSAEFIRVDPISGLHLDEMAYTYYPACCDPATISGIEYYAIGPAESPLGFELATMITEWWRTAGIPIDLVAGTWVGMTARLINYCLEDYQIMTDLSISWRVEHPPTRPSILYEVTHSENIPIWNFVYMNYSEPDDGVYCTPPPVDPYEYTINRDVDYWGEELMSAQGIPQIRIAAHQIQEVLGTHEPYLPLLEWMYE